LSFVIRESRRPVSTEAYQTLTLRDVVVETLRNGSLWQLDLQMHCQTAGMEATHVGTWDIRLTSHEDLVIMQRSVNASITGDSHRQGSLRLQFYIAVNQVNGAILLFLNSTPFIIQICK